MQESHHPTSEEHALRAREKVSDGKEKGLVGGKHSAMLPETPSMLMLLVVVEARAAS